MKKGACIILILLCCVIPITFSAPIENEGGFTNLQPNEQVDIVLSTQQQYFTKVTQTITQPTTVFQYTITEAPTDIELPANALTGLHIEYNTQNVGTTVVTFKLPKSNTGFVVQALTQNWTNAQTQIAYSTGTHTYYTTQANAPKAIAIIQTAQPEVTTNQTTQPQNESPSALQNPVEVEFVEETKPRTLIGIIIIGVIILAIVLAVMQTLIKHKLGNSSIKRMDSKNIQQYIQQALKDKKTKGQIVDELLDKKYSLAEILTELEKHGKTVPKPPMEK